MEVQLEGVTVKFGQQPVLHNFSLHLKPKERLLLSGASGSGKSTLLRLLLGFHAPARGNIYLDRRPLTPQNVWELRRRIAYVPQRMPEISGTALQFLKDLHRFRANQALAFSEERIAEYFREFGLAPEQLRREVRQLSGGEQQRLSVISALLLDRELLLLDEVTAAVDEQRRAQVIERLSAYTDKTMIVAAHHPGWELDRTLELQSGQDA